MNKIASVVLAGSPNTGKSTLFNRLSHSRRSITSPIRGVTRDLIEKECTINGIDVRLIDTGGIKSECDTMDSLVKQRSISAIKNADVILLLLDAKRSSSEDEEIIESLRPYSDKIILVVNKLDSEEQDNLLWNFYSYGFDRVVGISASHDRGINELKEYIVSMINTELSSSKGEEEGQDEVQTEGITISIMGKPNAGKSTLTNALAEDDISLVSDIPGTTRDTVTCSTNRFGVPISIIDTAGIRRKGKVKEDIEYYSVNRAINSIEESDVVLLMISAEDDVSDQDKKIASLVVDREKPLILVINKKDLWSVGGQEVAYIERLKFLFPILSFAPIVTISARDKSGFDELIKKIIMVHKETLKRVSTADFNTHLTRWKNNYTPRRGTSGAYKVLYGTQASSNPVEFVIFVNRVNGFPENYVSYLKNKIRQELGFAHIPFKLTLRSKKGDE